MLKDRWMILGLSAGALLGALSIGTVWYMALQKDKQAQRTIPIGFSLDSTESCDFTGDEIPDKLEVMLNSKGNYTVQLRKGRNPFFHVLGFAEYDVPEVALQGRHCKNCKYTLLPLDYDRDGQLDIQLTRGPPKIRSSGREIHNLMLYSDPYLTLHNDGEGRFSRVHERFHTRKPRFLV
jgi:hypothetical protein